MRRVFATSLLLLLAFVCVQTGWAQDAEERRDEIVARLRQAKTFFDQMPPLQREALSAGAQTFRHVAENWPRIGRLLGAANETESSFHDPSLPDNDFGSVLGGRVHSESSTAWCGSNVVVASNDSGSVIESLFQFGIGLSFNGFWQSTDAGASFADKGFMPPGTNVNNFLVGDPVAVCTNESTFYQSSILESADANLNPLTEVSVSKSTDGGSSFSDPIVVAQADGNTHFFDKDWMAADPTTPATLYVTYTDVDITGKICGFTNGMVHPDSVIKIVKSTDAGATWGAPVTVTHACGSQFTGVPFVQGSQIAVGRNHAIFVSWERVAQAMGGSFGYAIQFARSTNGGASFSSPVKATTVHCTGDCFGLGVLQGNFRLNQFPAMVLDNSGAPHIFWNDGTHHVFDVLANGFKYGYTDIMTVMSANGGVTWTSPVRVNTNVEPLPNGRGTDQFMPAVGIDKTGLIAACYYSRQNDPNNYQFDRYCATSRNGTAWTATRVTKSSSPPIHDTDVLIAPTYMGDYDTLATDRTGINPGFIGAYEVNNIFGQANLRVVKF